MNYLNAPYLSLLRNRILLHLTKGRIVWIAGGPGSGKTYLARLLLRSRSFRKYFIPLIDYDNFPNYTELFKRGGWGEQRKYYFIDSYDIIKIKLDVPSLVVSQTPPETHWDIVVITTKKEYLERWPEVKHQIRGLITVQL